MARNNEDQWIEVPDAPTGWSMLKWIGPGIIWMVSALGTGELLFTPRIASIYGYSLLWAMVLAVFLKMAIAREIGRYTIVTGKSVLHGLKQLPGPSNWAIWLIVVPQVFVAVTTIAGMSAITGSTILVKAPGGIVWWALLFLAASIALVLWGRYKGIETASMGMSAVIAIALVIAAGLVFPSFDEIGRGLIPSIPSDMDYVEVLPWIGFIQAGAAGLLWYSYWIKARKYGMAGSGGGQSIARGMQITGEPLLRLKRWMKVMTITLLLAVLLTLVILFALMILGAELLAAEGIVPEGPQVARDLSRLLGEVWGQFGVWLFIIAAFLSFWSTVVTDQDGWARMLGNGGVILSGQLRLGERFRSKKFWKWFLVLGLMGIIPAAGIIIEPDPVFWLSFAGVVEAVHIPIITVALLYLNLKILPKAIQPSPLELIVLILVTLFFLFFAGFYLLDIIGLTG